MPDHWGYHARTRQIFKKEFRKHGLPGLTTYLNQYKMGDYVTIIANSSVQKTLPHRKFHGKTGRIFSVSRSVLGVKIKLRCRERYKEKLVYVRFEHVKPSNCRKEFLERIEKNKEVLALARKEGRKICLKRLPPQPNQAHIVSTKGNKPILVTPVPYESLI